MAEYFIDDIILSEYTKVTLYFNDGFMTAPEKIEGFLVDDTFSLDATSNWSDLSEDGHAQAAAKLAGSIGETVVSKGLALVGIGNKPVSSTVQQWDGSERPQFDVSLLFVHTKNDSNDRPENKAMFLNARCFPKIMSNIQAAPMGYKPILEILDIGQGEYQTGQLSRVTGTVTLKIGEWFMAPNLLLMNSSFEFSKECAPDYSPLYAQGKVQLTTARIISYVEYLNYFKRADKSWVSSQRDYTMADIKQSFSWVTD